MKDQNTPTNTLEELRKDIAMILYADWDAETKELSEIMQLVSQAVNKAEIACAVYMEPGRFQDYKNRRDGTFQNDPRLNRDETPNQVEGK